MREYKNTEAKVLEKLICNRCGKEIVLHNGLPKEGVFHVRYAWDYMSEKDGMEDTFDLCEACYDHMVKEFQIPIIRREVTEYL